jgi:hypothetical protein
MREPKTLLGAHSASAPNVVTRAGVHAPVNLSIPARYAGTGEVLTGILRVLPATDTTKDDQRGCPLW